MTRRRARPDARVSRRRQIHGRDGSAVGSARASVAPAQKPWGASASFGRGAVKPPAHGTRGAATARAKENDPYAHVRSRVAATQNASPKASLLPPAASAMAHKPKMSRSRPPAPAPAPAPALAAAPPRPRVRRRGIWSRHPDSTRTSTPRSRRSARRTGRFPPTPRRPRPPPRSSRAARCTTSRRRTSARWRSSSSRWWSTRRAKSGWSASWTTRIRGWTRASARATRRGKPRRPERRSCVCSPRSWTRRWPPSRRTGGRRRWRRRRRRRMRRNARSGPDPRAELWRACPR